MISSEMVLEEMSFDRIFADDLLQFDLRGGVILNAARSRVCLLTTDFLKGIYHRLAEEAGGAWKPILYGCGKIWGQRLATRLDNECHRCLEVSASNLALGNYLEFITGYFAFHGWGKLELNLALAMTRGIIQVELTNSIFISVVDDPEQMADAMIAGMLSGLFSMISGHALGCVQTECPTKGAKVSRFILTAEKRLQNAEKELKLGSTHEQLVKSLSTAC